MGLRKAFKGVVAISLPDYEGLYPPGTPEFRALAETFGGDVEAARVSLIDENFHGQRTGADLADFCADPASNILIF